MKIIVLVKVVPDPEGVYALDGDGNILSGDLPRVLSVFDENAVEAAVQLQEDHGATVTVLSYGEPGSDKSLVHALAMGADEAVLVEDEASGQQSSKAIAAVLAPAIRKLGGADLILAGRESSDAGQGLVGPLVAQMLDLPFLTLAVKIEVADGGLRVTRPAEDGADIFAIAPPLLLTVSNQLNTPRFPSVLKFLQAKKKPFQRWPVAELGVAFSPELDGGLHLLRRYQPALLDNCRLAEGASVEEKVDDLVGMLKEERLA